MEKDYFEMRGSEEEKSELIKAINTLPKESFDRLPPTKKIHARFGNEFGIYRDLEEPMGKQVVKIARSAFEYEFNKFNIPEGAKNIQVIGERNHGITNFDYEGFRYEIWM